MNENTHTQVSVKEPQTTWIWQVQHRPLSLVYTSALKLPLELRRAS